MSLLNIWMIVFVVALLAGVLVRLWLMQRQIRHVSRHRAQVPTAFVGHVSEAAHHKAADYTLARAQFGLWQDVFSSAVLLGWTLLGGLAALNAALLEHIHSPLWQQLALLGLFALVGSVLDVPLSWYQTFRLEARFGFNKTTPGLWLGDWFKGLVLGALIGLPLAALLLWLMQQAGSWWWLWAWGVWVAFSLLMMVVFPTWIAPLFNRFTPLDNPDLEQRITALMQRSGFSASGLFVMDGSRRSAHANAYFTGLGRSKRVVFYDTLLQKLTPGEVEAVLAHELGHFAHRHIMRRMVLVFAASLLGFALLGWLYQQPWFYAGLGVMPNLLAPNAALALLLFMLVLPVFSFFLSPLMAAGSRRHEFEADAYAARHASAADLRSALLKLYEDNASTLTPDPVYVRWYYSHPPAAERLQRLQQLQQSQQLSPSPSPQQPSPPLQHAVAGDAVAASQSAMV